MRLIWAINRKPTMSKAAPLWMPTKPTAPGIYPASTERNPQARRYFNGRRWSAPWFEGDPKDIAERAQRTPARLERGQRVEWVSDAHA